MLTLLSSSSGADAVGVIKAALPIGIGLASAAFLTLKMTGQIGHGVDKVYCQQAKEEKNLECVF